MIHKVKLRIEKCISRSNEDCYKAFTDEKQLSAWFTTNAKCDLRVGGYYSNDDKDEGIYLELVPFERIKFTWDNKEHCPGTEVEVELKPSGNGNTEIILTHMRLESEKHIEEMKTGWRWALSSLKSYLETGKPVSYNDWKNSEQN